MFFKPNQNNYIQHNHDHVQNIHKNYISNHLKLIYKSKKKYKKKNLKNTIIRENSYKSFSILECVWNLDGGFMRGREGGFDFHF